MNGHPAVEGDLSKNLGGRMLKSEFIHGYFILFRLARTVVLASVLLTLSGCRPDLTAGNYEGSLVTGGAHSRPVNINLQFEQPYVANLEIKGLDQTLINRVRLKWSQRQNLIKATVPSLGELPVVLYPVRSTQDSMKSWKCYQGSLNYLLSLCLGEDQFILRVSSAGRLHESWSLSGDLSALKSPVVMEKPADYRLSDALSHALGRGFEARMEFQRVVQASEAARIAYFNLLPHLDYKSALGISSLAPRTIANFVANFVPFIIPTRWIKVREAVDLKKAEQITLDILRADLTYQVETLGYVYDRDRVGLKYFDELKERVKFTVDHVTAIGSQDFGKLGMMFDELGLRSQALLNFILQERVRLQGAIGLDRTALSLSMGFMNPEAVNSIDLEEDERAIDGASEITPQQKEDIIRAAVGRSLELKQIDYLIDNAERQKEEYYFNWADPDVPSQMSISFSLVPYLARASAVIKELLVRREQVQAQVAQRAANAVINYNAALGSYQIAKPEFDLLSVRLEKLITDITLGTVSSDIHTSGPNFQWALNTHLQFRLRLYDSVAMFRMARAQLRRVLLETYYSRLLRSDGNSDGSSPLEYIEIKIKL